MFSFRIDIDLWRLGKNDIQMLRLESGKEGGEPFTQNTQKLRMMFMEKGATG